MSNRSIDLDIDIYGSKIRESALADFLEVQAFSHSMSYSRSELSTELSNLGFLGKETQPYLVLDQSGPSPKPLDFAGLAFDIIAERKNILGPSYPFEVKGHRVCLSVNDPENYSYTGLLALTIDHAFSLHDSGDTDRPEDILEDVVTEFFRESKLLAENLAAQARLGKGSKVDKFLDAVGRVVTGLRLFSVDQKSLKIILPKNLNEDGVDIVCRLDLGDDRHGQIVLIGQVTCAKSDQWEYKIAEPKKVPWTELLGNRCAPLGFLAVPHHVTNDHLHYLVSGSEFRPVFDRIRMSQNRDFKPKKLETCVSRLRASCVVSP